MSYKFYLQATRIVLVAMFFTQCFAPKENMWDDWKTPQRHSFGHSCASSSLGAGTPDSHDSVFGAQPAEICDFDGGLFAAAESAQHNPLGDDYETPRRDGLDAKDAFGQDASSSLGTPAETSEFFNGGLFAESSSLFEDSAGEVAATESLGAIIAEPAQQNPQAISSGRLRLGSAKSAGGKPARRKRKPSRLAKDSAKPKSPVLTFFQREEQAAEILGEQLDEVQEAIHYRNLIIAVRRLLLCDINKEFANHKAYGDKASISTRGRFKRIIHSMNQTENMIIKRIWFAQILALEICEISELKKLSQVQEANLWKIVVDLITVATKLICSFNQNLLEITGSLFFVNNLVEFLLEKQALSDTAALLMLGRLDDPGLTEEQKERTRDRIAVAVGKKELSFMFEKNYESIFLKAAAPYCVEQKALLWEYDCALNVLKKFILYLQSLHFMSPLLSSLLKEQFLGGKRS